MCSYQIAQRCRDRFGLPACGLLLALTSTQTAFADGARQSVRLVTATKDALELDRRDIKSKGEPRVDKGRRGPLKFGAYCGSLTNTFESNYYLAEDRLSSIEVETALYSSRYEYSEHDFVSMLIVTAREMARAGDRKPLREEDSKPTIFKVSWKTNAAAAGQGPICVVLSSTIPGRGVASWYHRSEDGTVVVSVGFQNVLGLPVQAIETALETYPSTVRIDEITLRDWRANDLAKWTNVLRTQKADESTLSIAMQALREHDRASFGLFEATRIRDDAEARTQAISDVIANIEAFVREHPKYQIKEVSKSTPLAPANE